MVSHFNSDLLISNEFDERRIRIEGTLDGATLRVHPEFKDEPAEASTSHIGGHDAPIEQVSNLLP
jgi:hypothetical protein